MSSDASDANPTGKGSSDRGEDDEGTGISRRDLLAGGGLVALLGGSFGAWRLLGNDDDTESGSDDDAASGNDDTDLRRLLDQWKEARDAMRTSPDHLPARADRLVESEDVEAVFELVRDEIVTLPLERDRWGGQIRTVRWGPQATLRGGGGTVREQAELLASLYERMGYETRIRVGGGGGIDGNRVSEAVFGQREREFAPEVSEAMLERWRETAQNRRTDGDREDGEEFDFQRIDTGGEDSTAVAERVLAAAGDLPEAPEFEFRWFEELLVVEATKNGETIHAAPFGPGLGFDEPPIEPQYLREAPEPNGPGTVEVRLSGRTATGGRDVEFVSGEWGLDELAGRQLRVQTLPVPDPMEFAQLRYSDVREFLPALAVQGPDLDSQREQELSVTGDPVTRTGDRLTVEDEAIKRNGAETVSVADPTDPAAVERLETSADASQFPLVTLDLYPRDGEGNTVDGLDIDAFDVTEDGETVRPSLISNRPTPRVMVLYDVSDSMPDQYSGEQLQSFVNELAADITDVDEGANVQAQSARPYSETGGRGSFSHLWEFVATAPRTETNLVVFVTDGKAEDERTQELAEQLEEGPPVVALDVDATESVDSASLQEIADLSGGTAVPGSDRTAAREAITRFVREARADLPGYVIEYETPTPTPETHTVSIETTADSPASAEATYTPEDPDPYGYDQLTLELTVSPYGPDGPTTIVERTLAGGESVNGGDNGAADNSEGTDERRESVLPPDVLDVEGALFGEATLSFEGWGVPLSVAFDDAFSARLELEEFLLAVEDGDREAAMAARENGIPQIPWEALMVQAPYPDAVTDDSLTFPRGPRVAMQHQQVNFTGEGGATVQMDVLPTARAATAGTDPERRRRLTAKRTARVAVVERALFDTSTAGRLADSALVRAGSLTQSRREAVQTLSDRASGNGDGYIPNPVVLAGADGGLTHWALDPESGNLRGVLPDASGGGGSTAGNLDDRADDATNLLSVYTWALKQVGIIGGYGSLALGVAGVYFALLARLYQAASLMVLNMEVRKDLIRDALENAAEGAAKTGAGAASSAAGNAAAANSAAGLMGN